MSAADERPRLDPDALLAYAVPEKRQTYGPRDCALYALSLGLGQDPMRREALNFLGATGPLLPFPTLPLVLGHPGFWLARPDTGVDATRVVHGEQSIEILKALPAAGTVTVVRPGGR